MKRRAARLAAFCLSVCLLWSLSGASSSAQIQGCSLPNPVALEPAYGALRTSLTPTLRVALSQGVIGPCKIAAVRWQVFYAPTSFVGSVPLIDSSKGGSRADRFIFEIQPSTLRPGQEYTWRTILTFNKDDNSAASETIGAPSNFTTTYVVDGACAAMPQPTLVRPLADEAGVALAPTLEIRVFMDGVDAPCRWEGTHWQVSLYPDFRALEIDENRSTVLSIDPGVFQIPLGRLQPETVYYWRARSVYGNSLFSNRIDSSWNAARFRTGTAASGRPQTPSPACTGLPLPVHIAPSNGATVSLRPTLEMFIPGLPAECRHDETAWQVLDTEGNYVYQTGFTPQERTLLQIPAEVLRPNTTYGWRVKVVGRGVGVNGEDVFSDWTNLTYFTTQP